MPINLTRIVEGDAISAASLNTPMGEVRTGVNDLDTDDIQRYSLGPQHIPSQIVGVANKSLAPAVHNYTNALHPYPGWNTAAGWATVNTNGSAGGGTALSAVFSVAPDLAATNVLGMMVYANVEMQTLIDAAGAPVASRGYIGCFAIQVRLTTGTIIHIARTERFCCGEVSPPGGTPNLPMWKDIPIRTFIRSTDLGAVTTVDSVRIVASVADTNNPMVAPATLTLGLKRGSICAYVLRAGAL